MLAPQICLPALMEMREKFGDRIYKRYGFVDAFHPTNGWTNPDVIGIDVGITLLSAENLRTGKVCILHIQLLSSAHRAGTRGTVPAGRRRRTLGPRSARPAGPQSPEGGRR